MKSKLYIPLIFTFIYISFGCKTPSNVEYPELLVKLILDRYSYSVGDTLSGQFTVINIGSDDKTFNFGSSCQYGIRIKNNFKIHRDFPEACLAVLTSLHIKSGESKSFSIRLKLMDRDCNNLNAGRYTIQAFLLIDNHGIAEKIIDIK